MTKNYDIGLLVLGFKHKKALKAHHQLTHPYFIFPDDTVSWKFFLLKNEKKLNYLHISNMKEVANYLWPWYKLC
jgi:hypothetical protein